MPMQATVTNPDPRYIIEHGRKVDKTGVFSMKLNNGKVDINLGINESGEFSLTGDQVGVLEAYGLKVDCPERNANVPVGSKKWREALREQGIDPGAELQRIEAAKTEKPKPAAKPKPTTPSAPGA